MTVSLFRVLSRLAFKRGNCEENLFNRRLLPASLSKYFYLMRLLCGLRQRRRLHSRQDMEFFEGGTGETFLHKEVSPGNSSLESASLLRALLLVMILGLSFAVTQAEGPQAGGNFDTSASQLQTVSISLNRVTIRAVVADSDSSRRQGLLGWRTITDDLGMLLDFVTPGQYAIHMQGMKFPIDAIWIDAGGNIQVIYEEIPPNSGQIYPSMFPCRYCLEVKAGFCKRNQIKMGQKVKFIFAE